MQTSKKRISIKLLGLLLGLSCFITACKKEEIKEEVKEDPIINEVEEANLEFLDGKVVANTKIDLFELNDDKLEKIGSIDPKFRIDLSDKVYKKYINIKDTNYYIETNNISLSDSWHQKTNHLIPFNKNLKTKDNYKVYDSKNNLLIEFNKSSSYPIYILENDDYKYGVLFQNEMVYIDKNDIESIYDNTNSNEAVGDDIAVLMYHFFYSLENGEEGKDANFIEINDFRNQLSRLKDYNYASLSMKEVYEFMMNRAQIPLNSVAITIDDNDPSVYKYAYPALYEYGMNATVFLITGSEDAYLSYENIEMREAGIELQSHSWQMHQGGCEGMGHGGRLLCTDYETGVNDTRMSFDYVDGGFVYCYPFGDYNDEAKRIIKDAGAKLAFTTEHGKIRQGMDLLQLPRIRISKDMSIDSFVGSID